ncbi:hypothetical protein QIH95_24190 [Bradyrhizobium japonicum]|nr:hypothetical protein [Bradyrhizobium japonicum]WLB23845.1 hypothetical protein QIH95_24190 [Bradyrhizobium japonicum]
MVSISLHDVCLDYPLYGAYDFSLKRRLLGHLIREPGEMGSSAPSTILRSRPKPAPVSGLPDPMAPASRRCCA